MYLEFFGLQKKPFGLTPDPTFLFLSAQHREALDHLVYGIEQKLGFVLITGDTGTGKTTLCRALLGRLDQEHYSTALVLNPLLSEEELLRAILHDFGQQAPNGSKKELLDELNRFLLAELAAGKTAVLIIDEAQHLSVAALEQVRLISNLETESEKLIQIVLVGSDELREKLELPELRHLQQRISVRYRLGPLETGDVRGYIQHRLAMAGAAGDIIFERGACRQIYKFSRGIPRLINMITDRALLAAYLEETRRVRRRHVRQAQRSLLGEGPEKPSRFAWLQRRYHPAYLGLFGLVVAALTLGLIPGGLENIRQFYLRSPKSAPATAVVKRVAISTPAPLAAKSEGPVRPPPPAQREAKPTQGGSQATEATNKAEPVAAAGNLVASTSPPAGPRKKLPPADATPAAKAAQREVTLAALPTTVPQYVYKPPYLYTVHVGSFKRKQDALERMRALRQRRLPAWVVWVDLGARGVWYRVLLGAYEQKEEAREAVAKIRQQPEFDDARQIAIYRGILEATRGRNR